MSAFVTSYCKYALNKHQFLEQINPQNQIRVPMKLAVKRKKKAEKF